MSEKREINFISKAIMGISLSLVILLFSALILTACDNASAEINEAKAEEIALTDAGLKPEEVERMIIKADFDDGRKVYEIDFYTKDTEYEYDVDAQSGDILKRESEPVKNKQNAEELMGTEAQKPDASQNQASESLISEEKAKEIAISHAGVVADGITRYRLERDRDDGKDIYEIEFWSGNVEYDYDIDARTGKIIKFDKDID